MFDDAEGKKYRPIGVSTGDAKTKCAREVKPEPLPEFSGDGCDGHRDVEVSCMRCSRSRRLREWACSELSVAKQRQRRYD
jgi:hypothetical protein